MRTILLILLGCLCCAFFFALGYLSAIRAGRPATKDKSDKDGLMAKGEARVSLPPPPVVSRHKIGDTIVVGDYVIVPSQAINGQVLGHHDGRAPSMRRVPLQALRLLFSVRSTPPPRFVTWHGWHRPAKAEPGKEPAWLALPTAKDESGNTLRLLDLDGWSWLPGVESRGEERGGDTGDRRIDPGTQYRNSVYFEPAPEKSKEATFTLPVGGNRVLVITGPIKRG
jgi:hypothetical protein